MSPEKKFELGDYVEVKDRIKILFEFFPKARIETTYDLTSEPDEKPKVISRAFIYRQPEDEKPAGYGTSWLYLPGATPYTRGSEIENAETSAVGRAIGMLGILIDKSIATSNEIENKREDGSAPRPSGGADADPDLEVREARQRAAVMSAAADAPYREDEELMGDYSGSGMVRNGTAAGYKLEARQGPDGHVIGFRMEFRDEKTIPQVIVEGPAGEALFLATSMNPGSLVDTRITVKGRLFNVKSNRSRTSWKRLRVSEWSNNDYSFPAKDDTGPEPPPDIKLVGEDAPTAPLFDDVA